MAATNGPDILKGTSAADVISGHGGDDTIFGYDGTSTAANVGKITAERVGSGFDGAVAASSAPGRPNELFVVQKDVGEIHILDPATGTSSLFLDIPDGELSTDSEQGLLGLAFHPDYQSNGRFFVYLVNAAGDLEIREYARSTGDPDVADSAPVQTIITIPHPDHANHNGGALAFGPNDGYLYAAVGDGGGGNDPDNNGQNTNTLLGTVLRLDVNGDDFPADDGRNYAIPTDNPFVGSAGADEIWAYGLRNAWRISFDQNGDLYIADVGQSAREEVNFQPFDSPGGDNYGWDLAEGTLGNPPPGSKLPVFEYDHSQGVAITGGYVYHGGEPSFDGVYFFADFGSARFWTLKIEGGAAVDTTERTGQIDSPDAALAQISSFGVDGDGTLYVVSLDGDIFRLDLTENSGDVGDTLRGGGGDDSVYGGPGDDHLAGNKGEDRLSGGLGDDSLRGGLGDDRVLGNAGDDDLAGGKGNDVLKGGEGADAFRFDTALKPAGNVDRLPDFLPGTDRILLKQSVFPAIGAALSKNEFHVGAKAADGHDRIIYNATNGRLFYDPNGDHSGGKMLFARLEAGLDLDHNDFLMV
jgi:glucose/arabinose dehydrogenase